MILTRAGQPRQDVELVSPESAGAEANLASDPLPEPVCPHAAPQSGDDLPEPLPPGVSWQEAQPGAMIDQAVSTTQWTGGDA